MYLQLVLLIFPVSQVQVFYLIIPHCNLQPTCFYFLFVTKQRTFIGVSFIDVTWVAFFFFWHCKEFKKSFLTFLSLSYKTARREANTQSPETRTFKLSNLFGYDNRIAHTKLMKYVIFPRPLPSCNNKFLEIIILKEICINVYHIFMEKIQGFF